MNNHNNAIQQNTNNFNESLGTGEYYNNYYHNRNQTNVHNSQVIQQHTGKGEEATNVLTDICGE